MHFGNPVAPPGHPPVLFIRNAGGLSEGAPGDHGVFPSRRRWDSVPTKSLEMDERIVSWATAFLQQLGLDGWVPPRVIIHGLLQ